MTSLKGKTVFITGASKGIGKQLALQMAGLGAKVSLLARSEKELEETAKRSHFFWDFVKVKVIV